VTSWTSLRPITAADAVSATAFACCGSSGKYGAADIQRQVQNGKAVRRSEVETDHNYLGVFDDEDKLCAVAYHEPAPQERVGVSARYLRFIALHDAFQRTRTPSGSRYADLLMQLVHDDILDRYPATRAVLARIHVRHVQSSQLLSRFGYVAVPGDTGVDPLYVRAL